MMKKIQIILFIFLLILSCKKDDKNIDLTLVLKNEKTGELIQNAEVYYTGATDSIQYYSNIKGEVVLQNISMDGFIANKREIKILVKGYEYYKGEHWYGVEQNDKSLEILLRPNDSLIFFPNPLILEANETSKTVLIRNNGLTEALSININDNETWLQTATSLLFTDPTGEEAFTVTVGNLGSLDCSVTGVVEFAYKINNQLVKDTLVVVKNTGNDAPPNAFFDYNNLSGNAAVYQFDSLEFDAGNSSDLCDGNLLDYSWSFDNGVNFTSYTNNPILNYIFQNSGTYTVTLRVRDIAGQVNEISETIPVLEAPSAPIFNPTVTINTQEDSVLKLNLIAIVDSLGNLSQNLTEVGVIWSEINASPDLSNTPVQQISKINVNISSVPYSINIWTGLLKPNTNYYVRAYAKSNTGLIGYSQVKNQVTEIMQFSDINGGGGAMNFDMGAINITKPTNQQPQHSVTLSPFKLSRTEVTKAQYAAFMTLKNLADYTSLIDYNNAGIQFVGGQWKAQPGTENMPVNYVSWQGAKDFCVWAGGSLPTEAQWEYAASNRVNLSEYFGTNNPNNVAVFNSPSPSEVSSMQTFPPFYLHDMNGNLAEWVNDWYGTYSAASQTNPQGPSTGSQKVVKGGSYLDNNELITNQYRSKYYPFTMQSNIGFRVAKN